jgi:hypothetical protein
VVGNKKDPGINASRPNAEVEAVDADPFLDLLASQSKRDSKEKKKAAGLALAPAIDPHGSGTREVRTPDGLAARRERRAFDEEEKTEIVDPATKIYRATRHDEEDPQDLIVMLPPAPFESGERNMTIILLLQTKQNHHCLHRPRPQKPSSCKRSLPRIWPRKWQKKENAG